MAFTVSSNSMMMSNDVHFDCHNTANADILYQVYEFDEQTENYNFLYRGSFYVNPDFPLELKELFVKNKVPEVIENIKNKYRIDFLINNSIVKEMYFTVFYGGISKILKRNLAKLGTNIFTKKLLNYRNNFFLTTRTGKNIITIPENEIEKLYFYDSQAYFYLICENKIVYGRSPSEFPSIICRYIDLNSSRKTVFNSKNLLANYFLVKNGEDLPEDADINETDWNNIATVCRIVITEAKPTDCFIKFLNSWGVYEKIALYPLAENNPIFEEKEEYVKYDSVILDYITQQLRKNVTNEFSASIIAENTDRKNFVLDMLMSDECFLIYRGDEYSAKVTMESKGAYDKTYLEASTIKVKIAINDIEEFFSSTEFSENVLPYDSTYLVDADGNELIDSNGNFLILI